MPDAGGNGGGRQVSRRDLRRRPEPAQELTDPREEDEFFATQGVGKDKYLATFKSFAIKGQVNQAKECQLTGVPFTIVSGKYCFGLGAVNGPAGMLNMAYELIAKERAARWAGAEA